MFYVDFVCGYQQHFETVKVCLRSSLAEFVLNGLKMLTLSVVYL